MASQDAKGTIVQALPALLGSVQLSVPRGPEDQQKACVSIQRVTRAWLARLHVQQLRSQQARIEKEENDVFIRVTTRINPKFSS